MMCIYIADCGGKRRGIWRCSTESRRYSIVCCRRMIVAQEGLSSKSPLFGGRSIYATESETGRCNTDSADRTECRNMLHPQRVLRTVSDTTELSPATWDIPVCIIMHKEELIEERQGRIGAYRKECDSCMK